MRFSHWQLIAESEWQNKSFSIFLFVIGALVSRIFIDKDSPPKHTRAAHVEGGNSRRMQREKHVGSETVVLAINGVWKRKDDYTREFAFSVIRATWLISFIPSPIGIVTNHLFIFLLLCKRKHKRMELLGFYIASELQ